MKVQALVMATAAVLATGSSAMAAASDVPVRKPGHWKISTIAAALGMTTIDACITPSDSIAATTSVGKCGPPEVQRAGDQTIVTVVCATSQGRETTSTLFTGDFTTWYRGIVKITSDPPAAGQPNLGVTIDAKYVGPECLTGNAR